MATSPWGLDDLESKMARIRRQVPMEVALVTQKYFEASWKKQGWDGKKWEEPKRRINGKGRSSTRAILVQTGKLRRSFFSLNKTWNKIVIVNSSPYAQAHNEGAKGVQYVRPHKRTGKAIKATIYGSSGFIDGVWKKGKRRTLTLEGSKYNVDGFARKQNIPQRQFIGQTEELTRKQIDIITKAIDAIFK